MSISSPSLFFFVVYAIIIYESPMRILEMGTSGLEHGQSER